jgi:hypothetical protein
MEERTHPDFPNYTFAEDGTVYNDRGWAMKTSRNRHGAVVIGLMKNHIQRKRILANIICDLFNDNPEGFDSVIHLDGDLENCAASNLMHRPAWFRKKYHIQITMDMWDDWLNYEPWLYCVETGEYYESPLHAAQTLGVLPIQVEVALRNGNLVYPGDYTIFLTDVE